MSETSEESNKLVALAKSNPYSNTENFLTEQIESIINETVLDEDLDAPMSHTNIENTVKAITEFMVICQRSNSVGTCKATMRRQLQLALQGRVPPLNAEDIENYETYYRLQYTVYERLYKTNPIYALFCMPTLNNLALHYLETIRSPEKARKCLNNVLSFYNDLTNGKELHLPEHISKVASADWVAKRTQDCLAIVEYFYTASLIICSRYYEVKQNYRMSMKVGLRYLRRLATIHAENMKESEWIETATSLAVTAVYSRALPQAVSLVNDVTRLIDKMEDDVRREEHNDCGHVTRINNTKRRFIKQLRMELDLSVIRVAIWTLEESYRRSKQEKFMKDEIYEKVETFPNVPESSETSQLPTKLVLNENDFRNLLKKAKNLLKLHKKFLMKTAEWTELQTRILKIAQMRI